MPGTDVIMWARDDHYTPGRRAHISNIVIHATAGTNSLDWLRWTSSPPVSCHILVSKAGVRYHIVKDEDTAWHAGRSLICLASHASVNVNMASLGLELENRNDGRDTYPDVQLEAAAYQIARWYQAYGYLRLYRHSDIDGSKSDPRGLDMASFHRRIVRHLVWMSGG